MLISLYEKVYDHFKGDPAKLTLLTIPLLIASDLPIAFFTLLDVLKLPSLHKYRIHYTEEVSSHLGERVYPPTEVLWKALRRNEFNLLFAYVIPGTLAIMAGNALKIFVFDETKDREKITWKRILKEAFCITFVADVLFYWVHRLLHSSQWWYQTHKIHHEFKYTVALGHHWMHYGEALMFALPQSLPPLLLIPFLGKSHLISMWLAMYITNWSGILAHCGYAFLDHLVPSWWPIRAAYHDFHHVDTSVNFAAVYEFTDMLFGTFVRAPIHRPSEVVAGTGAKVYDYVIQQGVKKQL